MIKVVDYIFRLEWRTIGTGAALKELVTREYRHSLQLAKNLRSRDRPTERVSEVHSWHNTRLRAATRPGIQEVAHASRTFLGEGAFAKVLETLDISGNVFAIKVVDLCRFTSLDHARQMLHREVKTLVSNKHVS